jgi:hypothetical protein
MTKRPDEPRMSPEKPHQPCLIFVGNARSLPKMEEFHIGKVQPYSEILDKTAKACQDKSSTLYDTIILVKKEVFYIIEYVCQC